LDALIDARHVDAATGEPIPSPFTLERIRDGMVRELVRDIRERKRVTRGTIDSIEGRLMMHARLLQRAGMSGREHTDATASFLREVINQVATELHQPYARVMPLVIKAWSGTRLKAVP
jgi:hypothetical protein